MNRVRHRITIGSAVHESGAGSRLVSARSDASLSTPVNACRIVLAPADGIRAAPGDAVKMELGDDSGLTVVFTGKADEVDWLVGSVRVTATGCFQSLAETRFNLLHEKAKAGDVVSDVAGRLGITTATVDTGLEFPVLTLGEGQSLHEQLAGLARRCGFDLYADAEDKLVFAPYAPTVTHAVRYGVDVLSFSRRDRAASVTGVELYGESPSSLGQGPDTVSWIAKKEVKGSAGTAGGLMIRIADPALKDLDAAGAAAQSMLDHLPRGASGTLTTLGCPGARLCDAVLISGMPDSGHDGTFKITGVSHHVRTGGGFTTVLDWVEA